MRSVVATEGEKGGSVEMDTFADLNRKAGSMVRSKMDGSEAPGSKRKRIAVMLDLVWPYRRHTGVFVGTQTYAREAGDWDCIVDEFVQSTLAENPSEPVYDGIIARATPALARAVKKAGVPMVNVWFNSPATSSLPGVFADFKASGRMAAEHLMQRGFRHFACLSGIGDRAQRMATEGFHETIQKRGCTCNCLVVERQYFDEVTLWKRFQREVKGWIEKWNHPIGVYITFPDATGRHIAEAVRASGLAIPEQVAIIQSENDQVLCMDPSPSLSSVDVVYESIGYEAAKMLDEMMKNKPVEEAHRMVEPACVIARQSTDFLAVDDELVATALRCISEMAHQSIDVNDICDAACSGRRTLERRFQNVLGRTIAEEILRLRIERAKRELAYTDTPIKQVARLAGFRDAKRLHEVFMREVQQSPSAYRSSLHTKD